MIFEDAPVASMESMSVRLGQPLGQAEQTAMARIAAQQAVQTQALEKSWAMISRFPTTLPS